MIFSWSLGHGANIRFSGHIVRKCDMSIHVYVTMVKIECRVKDGELWYMVPRGIWYLNTEKPRYCLIFAKIISQKDKRADDGPRGKNKLNVLRTVWDTSAGIWFILLYSFSEHVLHKESEKSQKMWTRQPTSIETQRKGGHTNDNLCCDNWTLK